MATQYRLETTEKHRRRLAEEAIQLAMKSQWEQAVQVNEEIIQLFPSDVEANNRLGKALMELGKLAEARDAYTRALELDPSNVIASKNLERLRQTTADETSLPVSSAPLAPHLFIEETGKTGHTNLIHLAPPEVMAKVTPGGPVNLIVMGRSLMAATPSGIPLGEVPARLALRLITLMEGGNRYSAVVASITGNAVRLIIKETFQDPSQAGKLSFPLRAAPDTFRGYIRPAGVLDYGATAALLEQEPEDDEPWEEETLEEEPRVLRREQLIEEETALEDEEETE